jgi:hypothetical protein
MRNIWKVIFYDTLYDGYSSFSQKYPASTRYLHSHSPAPLCVKCFAELLLECNGRDFTAESGTGLVPGGMGNFQDRDFGTTERSCCAYPLGAATSLIDYARATHSP